MRRPNACLKALRLPGLLISAACPAVFVALSLACAPATAQSFDATSLRQPTAVSTGWLAEVGDNPAWALPDFDDSHWRPFNAETGSLHTLFPHSRPEFVWYRLHLKVDPAQNDLAMEENYIGPSVQLFANGEQVMHIGSIDPYRPASSNNWILGVIPTRQMASGSVVLAIRVRLSSNEWANAFPGFYYNNLLFGQRTVLRGDIWLHVISDNLLRCLDGLMSLALLLGALLLYSAQRKPEYLWLALWSLARLVMIPINVCDSITPILLSWHYLFLPVTFLGPYLLARVYLAFVHRPVGWRMQLYLIVAGLFAAYGMILGLSANSTPLDDLITQAPSILLESVILPVILIRQMRRGNRDAGILLLPLWLHGLYFYVRDGAYIVAQIPAVRVPAFFFYRRTVRAVVGPFFIYPELVLSILATLSLALIILLRSNRMSRQQALLEGEVAAAREVQQVILPEQVESVPGFAVESVYQPAQQVGGDFFQVLPAGSGGLLLVVGDVAGKGLPAAMLVSVLVGAIRMVAEYSHDPAVVLAGLNQRLIGRTHDGFSTALAAHIAADGRVTIANAGHLSPYLDGREVELPGALPLGIVSGAKYETIQFNLPHGSRLTFYTDGVVEAQNLRHELFGFDRAKALSTQPAAAILEAAIRFGQSDDITVVSIERIAAIATAA